MAFVSMNFLSGMFTWSMKWGYRPEDTHPCNGVAVPIRKKSSPLITQPEMVRLIEYLELPRAEGGEIDAYTLAIRLQLAFAARASEILNLEWSWVDIEARKIAWPDSKTGPMWKPISDEAAVLLKLAEDRANGSRFVVSRPDKSGRSILYGSYQRAWQRVLGAVGIAATGTHAIRHRAATDIANSGIPIKVGMALTAHKRLDIFMGYVHLEEGQVHEAADIVAASRAAKLAASKEKMARATRGSICPSVARA